jgi:hypothetical protein
MPTDEHRKQRMTLALTFLQRYNNEGEKSVDRADWSQDWDFLQQR